MVKCRREVHVKGSASGGITNEDYERHYSRRLQPSQIRDFGSKQSSRRIYFTEFFKWMTAREELWTPKESELRERLKNSRVEETALEYFREKKWGKRMELNILKEGSLRLRFIRWFQQHGAALACSSTPDTHLMALQHGSELLEAAKRLELIRTIQSLLG